MRRQWSPRVPSGTQLPSVLTQAVDNQSHHRAVAYDPQAGFHIGVLFEYATPFDGAFPLYQARWGWRCER